jgi:hypothetical protein
MHIGLPSLIGPFHQRDTNIRFLKDILFHENSPLIRILKSFAMYHKFMSDSKSKQNKVLFLVDLGPICNPYSIFRIGDNSLQGQ